MAREKKTARIGMRVGRGRSGERRSRHRETVGRRPRAVRKRGRRRGNCRSQRAEKRAGDRAPEGRAVGKTSAATGSTSRPRPATNTARKGREGRTFREIVRSRTTGGDDIIVNISSPDHSIREQQGTPRT